MKTNTEQIETALETLIEAIKTNTNCPGDLRDRYFNKLIDSLNLLEEKLLEFGEKASIEEVERILEILTNKIDQELTGPMDLITLRDFIKDLMKNHPERKKTTKP